MSSGNPETREKILSAAWALLEEAEGREVRMSDIAKRAGVSRQAVYLHFPARAELLIATTQHIDDVKDVDGRFARSRAATVGTERLDAYIEAWSGYIPEIHGVARALMAMEEKDEAARLAWADRMGSLRKGFRAAVDALARDGQLSPAHTPEEATDILTAMVSVHSWAHLTLGCGWSQELYVEKAKEMARAVLVKSG